MSFNFKKAAQAQVSLSPIMVGREKMDTSEVVGKEWTIVQFNFAPKFDKTGSPVIDPETGEVDNFGVVVFKEEPEKYYCVGAVFTNVCKVWAAEFGGDPDAASDALLKEGGVRVRFRESKTKKGNNLTAVDIID